MKNEAMKKKFESLLKNIINIFVNLIYNKYNDTNIENKKILKFYYISRNNYKKMIVL